MIDLEICSTIESFKIDSSAAAALYNAVAMEEKMLKESMIEELSRSIITEINNLK